jgi:hypothetical protein
VPCLLRCLPRKPHVKHKRLYSFGGAQLDLLDYSRVLLYKRCNVATVGRCIATKLCHVSVCRSLLIFYKPYHVWHHDYEVFCSESICLQLVVGRVDASAASQEQK